MARRNFFLLLFFFLFFASASAGNMGVNPYVTVTQEHDDNILYSAEERVEDVVTTLSYGLGIRDWSERVDASASAGFDWKTYSENPELDGLDSRVDASVFSRLTERVSLSAATEYSLDSQLDREFEETGMVDETGGPVVERVVRTRVDSDVSTAYALSETTRADLSYAFSQSDFDDFEFADDVSHNGGIGLERNISDILPETTADIRVNYLRYESSDYKASDNGFGRGERTDLVLNSWSAVAGLDTRLSEKLDVMVHLGGRVTDSRSTTRTATGPLSEESNDGWGTVGTLKFRYNGEYTECDLSLTHDIKPRTGAGGTLSNTASVFRVMHRLTEKVRLGLSAGYYLSRSDEALSSGEVDEHAMRIRPDFEYAVSKHISLEGLYSFRSVVDERADTETERNLVMVKVSYRYGARQ